MPKYTIAFKRSDRLGTEEYDGGTTLAEARKEAQFFSEHLPATVRIRICTVNGVGSLVTKEVFQEGSGYSYPLRRAPRRRSKPKRKRSRRRTTRTRLRKRISRHRVMSLPRTLADVEGGIRREQQVARGYGVHATDTYATDSGPEHKCGGTLWTYKVTSLVNGTRDVFPKCASCLKNDRVFEVGDGDYTIQDIKRAHEHALRR